MKKNVFVLLLVCLCLTAFSANAEQYSKVVSCQKQVQEDCEPTSGGGAVLGGGAGAWLGRALIGGPIGLIGGAVAGGLAGNGIEKRSKCSRNVYYIITLRNGTTFDSDRPMRIGQRVTLD